MLLQLLYLTRSAISVSLTTLCFACVCSPNKEYAPECTFKSQRGAVSPLTNGKLKDTHFNTGKHTAHAQHLFCRALLYRICTIS